MTSQISIKNPYVGLLPFESQNCQYFFGRREQTSSLLDLLYKTNFLAVVGSSGCGKSSLIRAGLIPALKGGFLVEDRDKWHIAVLKPGDAPLWNLAIALRSVNNNGADDRVKIEELYNSILELHTQAVIEYIISNLGKNTNLLLFLDQFEEIFRFRGLEEEGLIRGMTPERRRGIAQRKRAAAAFIDIIIELSAQVDLPIYSVLTMRTDFLGHCDLFYGLPEVMNRSRYLVPRLSRQQLRAAIEGPAFFSGASISSRLLDALLNELGDRFDRLPVLQHLLMRMWDVWSVAGRQGEIDLIHYEQVGTLESALAKHAELAIHENDLRLTAAIFKCLTDIDAAQRRIRRPSSIDELAAVCQTSPASVLDVIERFRADGRHFFILSESIEHTNRHVEISHESLIRQWPRLAKWVDEEAESAKKYYSIAEEAVRQHKGEILLMSDPALELALKWRKEKQPNHHWANRYHPEFELSMAFLDQFKMKRDNKREDEVMNLLEEINDPVLKESAKAKLHSKKPKEVIKPILNIINNWKDHSWNIVVTALEACKTLGQKATSLETSIKKVIHELETVEINEFAYSQTIQRAAIGCLASVTNQPETLVLIIDDFWRRKLSVKNEEERFAWKGVLGKAIESCRDKLKEFPIKKKKLLIEKLSLTAEEPGRWLLWHLQSTIKPKALWPLVYFPSDSFELEIYMPPRNNDHVSLWPDQIRNEPLMKDDIADDIFLAQLQKKFLLMPIIKWSNFPKYLKSH